MIFDHNTLLETPSFVNMLLHDTYNNRKILLRYFCNISKKMRNIIKKIDDNLTRYSMVFMNL